MRTRKWYSKKKRNETKGDSHSHLQTERGKKQRNCARRQKKKNQSEYYKQ